MKIVQVGLFPEDQTCMKGGIEASVYGLSMELSKKHEVSVFDFPRKSIERDKVETTNTLKVYRFAKGRGNNFFSINKVLTVMRKIKLEKPEICHLHSTDHFSFYLFLLLIFNRIPSILTVHGLSYIERKKYWRKKRSLQTFVKLIYYSFIEFIFLSSCKNIIVDTQYVKEQIHHYKKRKLILRIPNCTVIPQGINDNFFNLKNEPAKNSLISVGLFSLRKGHEFAIKAFEIAKQEVPDLSMKIVGIVSDQNYFKTLGHLIKQKKLEENITLCANISLSELYTLYEHSTAFILHSSEESQGIVFCEAMATGLPIIATNVGGIPNIVKNGHNGLLSEFSDTATFAKNIVTMLNNNELRSGICLNNKNEARLYSWEVIANKILKFYSTI